MAAVASGELSGFPTPFRFLPRQVELQADMADIMTLQAGLLGYQRVRGNAAYPAEKRLCPKMPKALITTNWRN